jgi:hemoglobin
MTEPISVTEPISDYEAVGGAPAVRAVVDDFYRRVLGDPLLLPYFNGVDISRVKRHQAALISQVMGGPVTYEGRALAEAHKHHLGITDAAFDRVAEHLEAALRDAAAPEPVITRTLTAVAETRGDIVRG